jgi:hypothetical protein
MTVRHVIPIGDRIAKSKLLATVLGAIIIKEVCDFFATLAIADPNPWLIKRFPSPMT